MTVINSIREIITMPVQGITNGCQPVLGYNYGAGQYQRVRQGIRFTTVLTVVYSVAVWAVVMLLPEPLIRIFNNEPDLIAAGIPAFRIYFATFFFMSFQFIGQSVFVGLGRSKNAIFFSLLRKAFIVAPLTLILPAVGFGADGVFLAEPISNVFPMCWGAWPASSPCISRSTGGWTGHEFWGVWMTPQNFFILCEIFCPSGGYS